MSISLVIMIRMMFLICKFSIEMFILLILVMGLVKFCGSVMLRLNSLCRLMMRCSRFCKISDMLMVVIKGIKCCVF